MTDPAQAIAKAARQLAGDYPLLLATAGSVQAIQTGTIGRQSNVHGVPGGAEHHSLTREARDALWGYAEVVHDVRSLDSDVWSNAVYDNARKVANHADALDGTNPLGCAGHARSEDDTGPRWHADVAAHLACIAHRVRLRVEPAGARVLVGLCPTDDDHGTCEQPLRANGGAVRCVNGHVHDTATIRDLAVTEASQRVHTLATVVQMAPTLWQKRVKYDALEKAIRTGRLASTRDPQGRHLVRVQDVAAVVVHGA